jgi:hypothetical protein
MSGTSIRYIIFCGVQLYLQLLGELSPIEYWGIISLI